MFTQCPECKKVFSLGGMPSNGDKTQLFCDKCSKDFNVVEFLSDTHPTGLVSEVKAEFIAKNASKNSKTKPRKKTKNRLQNKVLPQIETKASNPSENIQDPSSVETFIPSYERLPWEIEKTVSHINWHLGVVLGLVLLLGQLIYFEVGELSQNVAYRPYLEKLCLRLGCQLPDYKNLNEFEVLQGSFTPNPNDTFTFNAVISNQAIFKQRLPMIKLTLLDFQEQIFAQRIFKPSDFMPKQLTNTNTINPEESIKVQLQLRSPKTPIGGYNFDLVY